jgi:sugar lactone lactonase YvrE
MLAALLYVAQPGANAVLVYRQSGTNQSPIRTLTSRLSIPEGVFVDGNHDIYVTNFGSANIVVFKRGASAPYKTLKDPGQEPEDPIVDSSGNIFVTNFQTTSQGPGSISVYAPGATSPTSTLTVPNNIDVLWEALDSDHNLYVGYYGTSGPAVGKFKNATGNLIAVPLQIGFPGGMKFDSTQDLVLADQALGVVDVYELPNSSPSQTITPPSGGSLVGLAFNHGGTHLYVADATTAAIYEFAYPSATLVDTITKGLNTSTGYPTGIATDPAEPF